MLTPDGILSAALNLFIIARPALFTIALLGAFGLGLKMLNRFFPANNRHPDAMTPEKLAEQEHRRNFPRPPTTWKGFDQ